MQDETIMPVRHTTLSGVGATTAGTVGGAATGALKGYLGTMLVAGALGAVGLAFAFAGAGLLGIIGGAVLGFGGGAAVSAFIGGPLVATINGLVGGVKGGLNSAERVYHEKGTATIMDAQVAAAYAQQAAAANININTGAYGADNKYNFPAHGSAMNQASSSIQASTAEAQGTALDRARQLA